MGAFPEAASPTSITSNYPVSFSIPALPPPVSLNVSVNAPPSKKETKPSVPCLYTPLNFISSYLAQQYGLVYPPRHVVSAFLRNGVSPGCRSYQLKFLVNHDENGNIIYYKNGRVSFKDNWLFERWLFWKDDEGNWQPNYPPFEPAYLGHYGTHDFWTTSDACLSDFMILAIDSTANSHATAQASPKTGSTPSLAQ